MSAINWPQVIIALLSGGAAGAIINAVVSAYRTRRQPIEYRIDVLPVFQPAGGASQLRAAIKISHGSEAAAFENLFLAEIHLVNKGNADLAQLRFGATLGNGDSCIYVEATPPDRHHRLVQETVVTPVSPMNEVDFTLEPFHRGDAYHLKFYIVVPQGNQEPGKIQLGSSSPVRFVQLPTVREILEFTSTGLLGNIAASLVMGVLKK